MNATVSLLATDETKRLERSCSSVLKQQFGAVTLKLDSLGFELNLLLVNVIYTVCFLRDVCLSVCVS